MNTYLNRFNSDILFNFDFATDVFKFTESSVIKTTPVSTGFLKIIENNKINYVNCWEACTLTNTQAAVRIYKNSGIVNNFKLDIYDDINNLNDLEVRVYINGVRLNQNSGTTINWTLDSDSIYNIISLTNDILDTDILTIRSFSKQPINSNGYYELPLNLQNNPQNKTIESISLSEMLDHVDSIVDNLGTQFIGDIPGSNNLRDLPYISSYGTKFIKHGCPFELSLFHITSETTNVIKSLEKSRDEYNKFKRTFLMVAETLGVDTDAKTHVDLILTHINKNIPLSDPYYYSDMIPYGRIICVCFIFVFLGNTMSRTKRITDRQVNNLFIHFHAWVATFENVFECTKIFFGSLTDILSIRNQNRITAFLVIQCETIIDINKQTRQVFTCCGNIFANSNHHVCTNVVFQCLRVCFVGIVIVINQCS